MSKRVLVVDDSVVFCRVVERMLVRAGVPAEAVETVHRAREGAARFRARRPDLVFLDVQLPDREGQELAETLYRLDPSARLVATAEHGLASAAADRLRDVGVDEIVEKPVHASTVRDLVARLSSGRGRLGRIPVDRPAGARLGGLRDRAVAASPPSRARRVETD